MFVASPATGPPPAALTLSALSWRETAANLRSRWKREPSPGTPTGRETTGIETSAMDTSGGAEGDQTGVEAGFRARRSEQWSTLLRSTALAERRKAVAVRLSDSRKL